MSLTDAMGCPSPRPRAPPSTPTIAACARCSASARTPSSAFQEALAHDPDFALARAGLAVSLLSRREDSRGPRGDGRRGGGGARAARRASAATSRRSRSGSAGAATRRSRVIKAILAEHPRDVVLLQRLYFIHFWQGRSADMLDLTESVRRRLRRATPTCSGCTPSASRRTGASTRRWPLAERAMALNPKDAWAVHAMAHVHYERGDNAARHRGAAAAHSSLRPSRILQEPPALAPRPHAPGRGALRARGAPLPERVRRHPDHRSDPTFRIPCRSRGGSTSSAIRTRGAGSTWARRPARWLDLPLLLFHDAHVAMALAAAGDWPIRRAAARSAARSGARRRGTPRCPRSSCR